MASRLRGTFSIALLLLLLLLAPLRARAFEFSFFDKPLRLDLTESLWMNAHLDPGDATAAHAYYDELISRLNVQVSWNHFVLGVRLDSDAYVNSPTVGAKLVDAQCPFDATPSSNPPLPTTCIVQPGDLANRFQTHWYDPKKFFEKTFLSYSNDYVDATAGDFYISLGRGMVLSIRKLDQLAVDTTILGGKVTVHAGDFSGTVAAGWTNTQNLDDSTTLYTPDPFDLIGGGRLDYRIAHKVSVGVEAAGGIPGATPARPYDHNFRAGVVVDAPRPLPWLSFYAEYVRQYDLVFDTPVNGEALYASSTIFSGITSWLLEFKDYNNFVPWAAHNDPTGAMVYMAPPTLERVTILPSDNSNVVAGRLRTDVRATPWLTLFASPEFGAPRPSGGTIHDFLVDVYGGAELRWNDGRSYALPLVEYRNETSSDHQLYESLIALELDAAQSITGPWSMELQGYIWFRNKPEDGALPPIPWQEGDVFLALKWAPRLSATVGYEFTTQEQYLNQQHTFVNGSIQWNITPAININLFAGGQRPGLVCISGVCRTFPAFEGVRLTFTARG